MQTVIITTVLAVAVVTAWNHILLAINKRAETAGKLPFRVALTHTKLALIELAAVTLTFALVAIRIAHKGPYVFEGPLLHAMLLYYALGVLGQVIIVPDYTRPTPTTPDPPSVRRIWGFLVFLTLMCGGLAAMVALM